MMDAHEYALDVYNVSVCMLGVRRPSPYRGGRLYACWDRWEATPEKILGEA
jgi:hypothetical protein